MGNVRKQFGAVALTAFIGLTTAPMASGQTVIPSSIPQFKLTIGKISRSGSHFRLPVQVTNPTQNNLRGTTAVHVTCEVTAKGKFVDTASAFVDVGPYSTGSGVVVGRASGTMSTAG